jgi:AcrR family transcriptional regulator
LSLKAIHEPLPFDTSTNRIDTLTFCNAPVNLVPVPRTRHRPTREATSDRVLAGALQAFLEFGIANATIESIVKAAGLTRGAFYSSFDNKDQVVVALLERHVEQAVQRNRQLADRYPDPSTFLKAIASDEGRQDVALGRVPILNLELMLYAIRTPEHRQTISNHLQTLRKVVGEIVISSMRHAGVTRELDAISIGSMLVALEDGFDLHRLIDPNETPADSYHTAVKQLQELLVAAPRTNPRKRPAPAR